MTEYDMTRLIPDYLASTNHEHRINMIGRPYQEGRLELPGDLEFGDEERVLAGRCLRCRKLASTA